MSHTLHHVAWMRLHCEFRLKAPLCRHLLIFGPAAAMSGRSSLYFLQLVSLTRQAAGSSLTGVFCSETVLLCRKARSCVVKAMGVHSEARCVCDCVCVCVCLRDRFRKTRPRCQLHLTCAIMVVFGFGFDPGLDDSATF